MLKGHNSVGRGHNIAKLEVNFVLSLCNFVMRSLDCVAHFFKCKANITTAVFAMVNRVKVKITGLITCFKSRCAVFIKLEEEEFTFRTNIEAVAHFCRLVNNFLKHISRVALKRSYIVCLIHRANKSCCLCIEVLSPRENSPCIIIRMQVHIRLVNSDKTVN